MNTENIFKHIPENLDDELVELLVQSKKIKIERIISKGHTSPATGWYDQDNDEWVLILKGAAIIVFDNGGEFSLGAGDYLTIPAHVKHKVTWTDLEKETVWLAIHY
ncbi:MAG: cupin [Gammaproteobacteria bacterium]|nr:MAG: cupin [Gammaproteobacteria bacterium]